MVDIDKAFHPENSSVYNYFHNPGVGFYIPLYQREYSWDNSNVGQLLDDIADGVQNMINDEKNEIRFLGTVITVNEGNKNKIYPIDTKALPSLIEKVIDGQQRLSTIALISAVMTKYVVEVENRILKAIPKFALSEREAKDIEKDILQICRYWKGRLYDIFSLDLQRGKPERKPKILRGSVDKWVMQEDTNVSYNSPVSKYIFEFIEAFFEGKDLPKYDIETNAGKNLMTIDSWIRKTVLDAHVNPDSDYLHAKLILKNFNQEHIWQYERDNLTKIVELETYSDKRSLSYHLSSLVQLLATCHYLLDRCCFTIIRPINDDWAFDMFQSLNATGTPLTAIETFKPTIVEALSERGQVYSSSVENTYFTKIESTFSELKNAATKSKMTNELLTSFALPVEAYRCPTHFSSQKKWLERVYEEKILDYNTRKEFIKFFGNYTEFYNLTWNRYKGENAKPLEYLKGDPEADLASLLTLYLIESNHKMAMTLLGSFYDKIIQGKEGAIKDYINLVKLIAGFYTIWRSAQSNSGLDDVYRAFFKGSAKNNKEEHTWLKNQTDCQDFLLDDIRTYLQDVLTTAAISNKGNWLSKSSKYLRYDNSVNNVCRFALFVSSHDTIPDQPGLIKIGQPNSAPFLRLEKWISKDLKTVEHIAPQTKSQGWDSELYNNDDMFENIGNLTLLPIIINSSAGNKAWKEKFIYYKHLSEKDPSVLEALRNKAIIDGIILKESTLDMLQKAEYSSHIEHITALGDSGIWDLNLVRNRSAIVLDILWNKVSSWVF